MKARATIQAAGQKAFSLIECMIAIAAFSIAVFAILALVSQSLQNARRLQRPIVDAGMLASELSLTNQMVEGTESGDFGDVYPGSTWTATTTEVLSNKLFEVDYTVQRADSDRPEKLSILLFRPQSKAGTLDGGLGVK
jgi:prepilin-type N-terminal cleavage/methylation domain-containing protein